jgi:hypothetical protein
MGLENVYYTQPTRPKMNADVPLMFLMTEVVDFSNGCKVNGFKPITK